MAKLAFSKSHRAFRANRGKQGFGAWGADEHLRHNKGLSPKSGKTPADRRAKRGQV